MKRFLILICILAISLVAMQASAQTMGERLTGRILLQVEQHGEAWYINPDTGRRHYMGTAADAYQLMRQLGLGISNHDFNVFGNTAPQRLAGKILIKVEDYGKAFYVNPTDLQMHFLGNAQDAYQVMRNLGLGIKDTDLSQIPIAEDTSLEATSAPNPATTESPTDNTNTNTCTLNIREYPCPQLVEYEFTHPENLSGLVGGFIHSGPPILRLSHAEFQGEQMACVYENHFASADVALEDSEFAFYLWAAESACPNFLGLNIRNKEKVAPDWKLLYPGYIKIDKTHAGHRFVTMNLYHNTDEMAYTYDGCVYSMTLQEDSDPTLRRNKDGYCIINDTNDGFKCADSLVEMYGTDNTEPHAIELQAK